MGRGPLAGPVVAACVVSSRPLVLPYLNDSKRVTALRRETLASQIRERADAIGIGAASPAEIDHLNILQATYLAMRRALAAAGAQPDYLFLDAVTLDGLECPQRAIIKGDSLCAIIAAASIIAKVHRDALLEAMDVEDPRYGYAVHKGYPTPGHLAALATHGPSPNHRMSFAPVRRAQHA
ncbi:MAG: ribonuclease HII [Vulcanimicrobiaceae bacterium]